MIWIAVVAATVLAVAIFLRTPFATALDVLGGAARKTLWTIRSPDISDHWKERVLPRYAGTIFRNSIVLFFCLLALIAPIAAVHFALLPLELDLIGAMLDWRGLLLSLATAALFVLAMRELWGGDPAFGPLDRMLHFLVLGTPGIHSPLFDMGTKDCRADDPTVLGGHHVFVSGMARAGTTVLMRALYDSGQFASLTYADMPFVLAPGFWSSFKEGGKQGEMRERAHGDGIMVNEESPEALEEVFWKSFAGREYITADAVVPHRTSAELEERFRLYIASILRTKGRGRYLSKNNNDSLRVDGILHALPNASVLVPFRHPLSQATSLMRQHRAFMSRHGEDRFTARYMNWLGHFEFGPNHRRVAVPGRTYRHNDPNTLEYWVEEWLAVTGMLERTIETYSEPLPMPRTGQTRPRVVPIGYEYLCGATETVWPELCRMLELGATATPDFNAPGIPEITLSDADLQTESEALYERLSTRCLAIFQPRTS